jgi:hypothetical protein
MPVSVFENYELQTVSHEYMTQGMYIVLRVTYPLDILTYVYSALILNLNHIYRT